MSVARKNSCDGINARIPQKDVTVDAKIKKIQKENKKEGKDLSKLLKADKKQDAKLERAEKKMKKGKC